MKFNETKFRIFTSMGKSNDWSKLGLTEEQIKILNDIGYGTNKQYKGFAEYLNGLGSSIYEVKLIHGDSGDFSSTYEVIRKRPIDFSHITDGIKTETYTGYLSDIVSVLSLTKEQYVTITISDASEILKQKNKEALVSKKEELLKKLKELDDKINNL